MMGTQIAKIKKKILRLIDVVSEKEDVKIRKYVSELLAMPQDILSRVENLEQLISTSPSASYAFLSAPREIKCFLKP